MLIARKISNLSVDGTRTIKFIFSRSVHPLLSSIGHSLHHLTVQNVEDLSLSLSTGAFPSSLKHGIITPLLKKNNSRPERTKQLSSSIKPFISFEND
jgi:hypothetical protein